MLDSHVLLWFMAGSARLGRRSAALISASESEVWISAATAWEITIKASLGRLRLADLPGGIVVDAIARYGFGPLPITIEQGLSAGALPPLHRDPFDRMLTAQAQAEGLRLVSADRHFGAYSVELLDARL